MNLDFLVLSCTKQRNKMRIFNETENFDATELHLRIETEISHKHRMLHCYLTLMKKTIV